MIDLIFPFNYYLSRSRMKRDRTFLNSCELYLEDLEINYSGIVYFLWRKGKRHVNSNQWEVQPNEAITLRERIQLRLKLYLKGEQLQPKNTHLYIINENDEEVASFILPVHEWSDSYEKMELPISQGRRNIGTLTLKRKRKQIMELDNFQKTTAELEQSSEEEENARKSMLASQHNIQPSEIFKLRKELEDATYINEKLKKDRTQVMAINDTLEKELRDLKSKVSKEIKKVEEYYMRKMEVHEQIFKEEIQNLITTFNDNSVINCRIMRDLISQNEGLEADKVDLRRISEEQLDKQEEFYKNKVYEVEEKNFELSSQISSLKDQLERSNRENKKLDEKLQNIRQEHEKFKQAHQMSKKQFQNMLKELSEEKKAVEEELMNERKANKQNQQAISEKDEKIEKMENAIKQLEGKIEVLAEQLDNQRTKNVQLEETNHSSEMQIIRLKTDVEHAQASLKTLQKQHGEYVREAEMKDQENLKNLIRAENQHRDTVIDLEQQIQSLKDQIQDEKVKINSLEQLLQTAQDQYKMKVDDENNLQLEFEATFKKFSDNEEKILTLEIKVDTMQHDNKRLNQELDYRMNQVEELTRDIESYQSEIFNIRQNFKEQMKDFEKDRDEKIEYFQQKFQNSETTYHKILEEMQEQEIFFKKEIDDMKIAEHNLISKLNGEDLEKHKLQIEIDELRDMHDHMKQIMETKDKEYEEIIKMAYKEKNQMQIQRMQASIDWEKKVNDIQRKMKDKIRKSSSGYLSPEASDPEENKEEKRIVIPIPQSQSELNSSKQVSSSKKSKPKKKKKQKHSESEESIDLERERKKITKQVERRLRRQFEEQLENQLDRERRSKGQFDYELERAKLAKQIENKIKLSYEINSEFNYELERAKLKKQIEKTIRDEIKNEKEEEKEWVIRVSGQGQSKKNVEQAYFEKYNKIKDEMREHLDHISDLQIKIMEYESLLRDYDDIKSSNEEYERIIQKYQRMEEKYQHQIDQLNKDLENFEKTVEDMKIQLDYYREMVAKEDEGLMRSAKAINQLKMSKKSSKRHLSESSSIRISTGSKRMEGLMEDNSAIQINMADSFNSQSEKSYKKGGQRDQNLVFTLSKEFQPVKSKLKKKQVNERSQLEGTSAFGFFDSVEQKTDNDKNRKAKVKFLENIEEEEPGENIQIKINELNQEIRNLEVKIRQKDVEIKKYQIKNKQLANQLNQVKQQAQAKIQIQEEKINQLSKSLQAAQVQIQSLSLSSQKNQVNQNQAPLNLSFQPPQPVQIPIQTSQPLSYSSSNEQELQIKSLKEKIFEKDSQIKEKKHEYELEKNKLNHEIEYLQGQLRKSKKQVEEYEKNNRKMYGHDQHSKMLQEEIEECNKKIFDLTRNLNQAKLEKQSNEDEIRILRKKMGQSQKNEKSINEKYQTSEQQLEDYRRKHNRLKRQKDDLEEQLSRLKDQNKKAQEEMSRYNTYSSQTMHDRKKIFEQKIELEETITKKEAQIKKLQKQNDNLQKRLDDQSEIKRQKKNNQIKEIESLTLDVQKFSKNIKTLEEQNQALKRQISTMEMQNVRRVEQNSLLYSDKLKMYVKQIANIKHALDETDEEMRQVRSDNISLQEELDMLRQGYEKLANREHELLETSEKLEQILQIKIKQGNQLQSKSDLLEKDSLNTHNMIAELQEQLNKQRMISMRKSQKVEQYEILSEKYLYQLKNLKVKLSNFQTKEDISKNLTNHIHQLQKQNQSLSEQLIKQTREFEKYKSAYIFTEEQINELVEELERNLNEKKKEEIEEIVERMEKQYEGKSLKLEKQVLQLYNDNARLGSDIQKKDDEYADLIGKLQQMEQYHKKYLKQRDDNEVLQQQIKMLQQLEIENTNRTQRAQIKTKELQRQCTSLRHELDMFRTSATNQSTKNKRLEEELHEVQTSYRLTRDQLQKINASKGEKTDHLITQLQVMENKLLGAELENSRIKEREENLMKEYKEQIKKLQTKLKQTITNLKQHSSTIQTDLKKKVSQKQKQLQFSIKERDSAVEQSKINKRNLEQLSQQFQQLSAELTSTRAQLQEDEELYIQEINKLKNQLKDTEEVYNINLNNLEEELAELNRELTQQKLNNRKNQSLKNSRLRESEVDRRLEEKMRGKDLKIEQLKNNVYLLEETVINLKKRYEGSQFSEKGSAVGKYKDMYNDLLAEFERQNAKIEEERDKMLETQKQNKKQLQKSKQIEQDLNLKIDQQNLQLSSLRCQLKTVRELYDSLQKEIDKRKLRLTQDLQTQSIYQKDLEYKNAKIIELQERFNDQMGQNKQLVIKMKKKEEQFIKVSEELEGERSNSKKMKNFTNESKTFQEINRRENQTLKEEIVRLQKQNKGLCETIETLKYELGSQKAKHTQSLRQQKKLQRELSQIEDVIKCHESQSQKYKTINDKCLEQHGVNIQDFILGGYLDEKMFDQEQEINRLAEELQEHRFNQDRHLMDVDELRRINFQLQLKMEDYEFLSDQVDGLRKICDKLEEEKKIAVFREQAIKVRLTNLVESGMRNHNTGDVMNGIKSILNYNYDAYA